METKELLNKIMILMNTNLKMKEAMEIMCLTANVYGTVFKDDLFSEKMAITIKNFCKKTIIQCQEEPPEQER